MKMATHIFSIIRLISEEAAFGSPFIRILGVRRVGCLFLSQTLFLLLVDVSLFIFGDL